MSYALVQLQCHVTQCITTMFLLRDLKLGSLGDEVENVYCGLVTPYNDNIISYL